MKKLDVNNLFSIFNATDEEVFREEHSEELLDNPYVLMGMVLRGVENFTVLDDMYAYKHGKEYQAVRPKVKHSYFLRLYGFLDRINFNKYNFEFMIGEDFSVEQTDRALNFLLHHFLQYEQYEKCAIIQRYIDLLHIDSVPLPLPEGILMPFNNSK